MHTDRFHMFSVDSFCYTLFQFQQTNALINWQRPTMNWGPFYSHGLTLIPAWISNGMLSNVSDGITYPFLNFNGANVEV